MPSVNFSTGGIFLDKNSARKYTYVIDLRGGCHIWNVMFFTVI